MKVTIKDKEPVNEGKDELIIFDYLGEERRSLVTPKIKEKFVYDFPIGGKVEVLKSLKGDKEFYKVVDVEK